MKVPNRHRTSHKGVAPRMSKSFGSPNPDVTTEPMALLLQVSCCSTGMRAESTAPPIHVHGAFRNTVCVVRILDTSVCYLKSG